jgi:hypothetical protein
MIFNCMANQSIVRVEMLDSEAMGQDRTMGYFLFMVTPNPVMTDSRHKLIGMLGDGRLAEGTVDIAVAFSRGGRALRSSEQRNEFQTFCETESYRQWLLTWLFPSRRIETAYFRIELPAHEREFKKAVGSLSVPLSGLAIKQYLTYVLVEHSHNVDVYSCREFCRFFKRTLDDSTAIMYRDIVKLVKERNSGLNRNDLFIGSVLNPNHWLLQAWYFFARLVSLYYIIMLPIRIAFQTEVYTMTSRIWLSTDLPADIFLVIHAFVLLNLSFKNSKSQWVTSRLKIFKNMDFLVILALVPFDWIVFLSGLDSERASWFRLNKMILYFSQSSPAIFLYSARGGTLKDLLIRFHLIVHIGACGFYYIGRKVPDWNLGEMNKISWFRADLSNDLDTYDRDTYHPSMYPHSTHMERYVLCVYWVMATVTCQGVVGDLGPQNFIELCYVVLILMCNLTIYRWIEAEISNIIMTSDEYVIRHREKQDRIFRFTSAKSFSPDLRHRIQSHFSAVQGNISEENDRLLAALSHGLRTELARLIWRDFLAKVYLFRGCSGQFVDALCVLLRETHYGPEQVIGRAGDVCKDLVILVKGSLEAYPKGGIKMRKISRKGHVVGTLSFFFGVRQYMSTRAARSGAVCIRISHDDMREVLQIYPKDEERAHQNALNFDRTKQTEGTVAFSVASGTTHDNDDEDSNSDSENSALSKGTKSSAHSAEDSDGSALQNKTKARKAKFADSNANYAHNQDQPAQDQGAPGESGDDDSIDADLGPKKNGGLSRLVDADDSPLMKETEHIPMIKERLVAEKISSLLSASARGDKASMTSLLSGGDITISSKDEAGRTALHIAASEGHVHLVAYLLESKADPSVKDEHGNTPFNDCVRLKHDNVVKLIRMHDPNIAFKLANHDMGVLLCQAAFANNLSDLKRLVLNGVDPNESDYDGRTAMHLAACEGHVEILEYLVEIRANIMCRDRFGGTPLEDAVRHNFDLRNAAQVQKLLRDHGATLSGEGLDYVQKMCSYAAEGKVENIRLLTENHIDVSLG